MAHTVIVKLRGGLGNQMFQYAAGKAVSSRINAGLVLDLTEFEHDPKRKFELDAFNIDWKAATPLRVRKPRKLSILLKSKVLKGKNSYLVQQENYYDRRVADVKGDAVLDGYWQSEKYFEEIADTIRREFTVRTEPDEKNRAMLERITSTNSVCLHVRRGDYVKESKTSLVHGTCSLEYYRKSVALVRERTGDPTFFVFSDDLSWAKESLGLDGAAYVDVNLGGKSWDDLRLMSHCKHFIIANSTFSWWAAWLSANESKIVCAPKPWYNSQDEGDLVPESWIRVDDSR